VTPPRPPAKPDPAALVEVCRFRLPITLAEAPELLKAIARAYPGATLGPQAIDDQGKTWTTVWGAEPC
jgi:hypothetical protein